MAKTIGKNIEDIKKGTTNLATLNLYAKENWMEERKRDMSKSMANFFEYRKIYNKYIPIPKWKKSGFVYNEKSVMILDDLTIPEAVKTCLSLGEKFIYDAKCSEAMRNAYKKATTITLNMMTHIDFEKIVQRKITATNMIFDNISRCIDQDDHTNSTKGYLRQCCHTTEVYLRTFPDIITAASDKGNILVVMKKSTYKAKLMQHINKGTTDGTYVAPDHELNVIHDMQTEAYQKIKSIYKHWTKADRKKPTEIPPLDKPHVAAIYGTIKVHKEGMPIRPIIADFNNPFKCVQEKIKNVLSAYINKNTYPFIINNTEPIISQLKNCIHSNHKLASIDYESMYTNIDLRHLYDIISNEYDTLDIQNKFGIRKNDFIDLIQLLMEEFAYISYAEKDTTKILKQSKGVPMGGGLSYHIAEVVTSRGILELTKKVPRNHITAIHKYVDDILIICDPVILNNDILKEPMTNMPYTIEMENAKNKIVFLNLELVRKNTCVLHKWYSKPYASHRTIDYYSAHPMHMKMNVLNQLLHTITTSCSYGHGEATMKFRHIASINHYPKRLINKIINNKK